MASGLKSTSIQNYSESCEIPNYPTYINKKGEIKEKVASMIPNFTITHHIDILMTFPLSC